MPWATIMVYRLLVIGLLATVLFQGYVLQKLRENCNQSGAVLNHQSRGQRLW